MRPRAPHERRRATVFLAVSILALLLVVGCGDDVGDVQPTDDTAPTTQVQVNRTVMGDLSAPVQIVHFGDFQ